MKVRNFKFGKVISICILISLWVVLSLVIHNDILVPYPLEVLKEIGLLLSERNTYEFILITLIRVFEGVGLSLVFALFMGIFGIRYKIIHDLFEPLYKVIKTVPNVSFIIMALIWFGPNNSVWLICFLIIFPILYSNIEQAIISESDELKDVVRLNDLSFIQDIRYHILPMLIPTIISSLKVCISMGIKVCVMAEILTQARWGIGKQLYLSKMNLNMTRLFAWTIIIILICIVFDFFFEITLIRSKGGVENVK